MELREFRELAISGKWREVRSDEAFLAETGRYQTALKTLSLCLKKHHGKNVDMSTRLADINAGEDGFSFIVGADGAVLHSGRKKMAGSFYFFYSSLGADWHATFRQNRKRFS